MLVFVGPALAEKPLPSYRDEVARAEYREVDRIFAEHCRPGPAGVACDEGATGRVIARVEAFERVVFPDAGLTYLAGLAHRYAGETDAAASRYEAAVALDPTYATAWYDLGEIWFLRGDIAKAEACFAKVAALRTEGDNAWVGPWRLAELAADRRDVPAFEEHLREALKRGFSFRAVAGLPNWRTYYAHPGLRDAIEKLVTVYGSPDLLDSFRE